MKRQTFILLALAALGVAPGVAAEKLSELTVKMDLQKGDYIEGERIRAVVDVANASPDPIDARGLFNGVKQIAAAGGRSIPHPEAEHSVALSAGAPELFDLEHISVSHEGGIEFKPLVCEEARPRRIQAPAGLKGFRGPDRLSHHQAPPIGQVRSFT